MKRRELSLLRDIYIYISAGLPFSTVATKVGGNISQYLQRGMPLSVALKHEGFPEFVVQNVKVGEETGRLKDSLKDIIDVFERIEKFRSDIKLTFAFPYLTFVLSICIIFGIFIYVVPQLSELISDLGVQQDDLSLIIVKISDTLRTNMLLSILIFAIVILSPVFLLFYADNPLMRYHEIQILLRSLALCLENGMELVRSLLLVSSMIGNRKLKDEIVNEASAVMRGLELNFSFLPKFEDDLKRAYEIGKLPETLRSISAVFEEKVKSVYEFVRRAIEPIFFIITGGIIILIAVLFYIPIFRHLSGAM